MQAPKTILRSPRSASNTKFCQTAGRPTSPLAVDNHDAKSTGITRKSEENQDSHEDSLHFQAVNSKLNAASNFSAVTTRISESEDTKNNPSQKNEATQTGRTSKSKKGIANPASITPTVILNGLAMARGETVAYQVVEKTALPGKPVYDFRNAYQYSAANPSPYFGYNHDVCDLRPPPVGTIKRWIYTYSFRVLVTVGDRSFTGQGRSRQDARHSAAKAALEVLQAMPIPIHAKKREPLAGLNGKNGNSKDDSSKSKVSILYEMVSASRLKIDFHVVSETGPPHLKIFNTRVIIYKIPSEVLLTAEGSGNNKSSAKARAAEAALEAIKINPLPENKSGKRKQVHAKGTNNLSTSTALHPSSRLSQIMQAQKKLAPLYTITSSGVSNPHNSLYEMQCTVDGKTAIGQGRSKKDAKRDASEKMLILLGFHTQSQPNDKTTQLVPPKPAVKSSMKAKSTGIGFEILPPLKEV